MPYIVTFEVQVTVDATNEREACETAVSSLPDNMSALTFPQGASYTPTAEEWARYYNTGLVTTVKTNIRS